MKQYIAIIICAYDIGSYDIGFYPLHTRKRIFFIKTKQRIFPSFEIFMSNNASKPISERDSGCASVRYREIKELSKYSKIIFLIPRKYN